MNMIFDWNEELKDLKIRYKKAYKFYRKELSNFQTVLKDTNNSIVTADQYNYNCMSYALGVYDNWLGLNAFEHSYCEDNCDKIDYDYMYDVFVGCCLELEMEYGVRRISGPEAALNDNERMIAFRIGADDFHFARRNSDGVWTHKPGRNTIREMTEEELLGEVWSEDRFFPYVSEVAFFAVINK